MAVKDHSSRLQVSSSASRGRAFLKGAPSHWFALPGEFMAIFFWSSLLVLGAPSLSSEIPNPHIVSIGDLSYSSSSIKYGEDLLGFIVGNATQKIKEQDAKTRTRHAIPLVCTGSVCLFLIPLHFCITLHVSLVFLLLEGHFDVMGTWLPANSTLQSQ